MNEKTFGAADERLAISDEELMFGVGFTLGLVIGIVTAPVAVGYWTVDALRRRWAS